MLQHRTPYEEVQDAKPVNFVNFNPATTSKTFNNMSTSNKVLKSPIGNWAISSEEETSPYNCCPKLYSPGFSIAQ